MYLGVDIGQTGAISLLDSDSVIGVWDMPATEKNYGKGREINAYLLHDLVSEIIEGRIISAAYIERVASGSFSGRKQGATGAFSFGRSAGVVEGVLAAHGLYVEWITPQAWKKHFNLTGKDKDASRLLALELFPEMADRLKRKKDNGRSDSVLIGLAGYTARR